MGYKEMGLSKSGNRYALVIQDYLAIGVCHKATTVAKCLANVIWRYGLLSQIIHDRAVEFLSNVVQETAQFLGIKQLLKSGGHPQTDGLVEKLNCTLKQMFSKVVAKGGRDWDELLVQFCLLIKELLMRLLERHHSL